MCAKFPNGQLRALSQSPDEENWKRKRPAAARARAVSNCDVFRKWDAAGNPQPQPLPWGARRRQAAPRAKPGAGWLEPADGVSCFRCPKGAD